MRGLLLLILLLAGPALAWEGDMHVAIVRAAATISPAFESSLPIEHRAAFYEEVATPDIADRICRYHRGPEAMKNPFAEAERLRVRLGDPKVKGYQRAQLLGRYLHYVGDAIVPPAIASGSVFQVSGFWANRDFIVFRERRPLTAPLGAALSALATTAEQTGDGSATHPALFRLVVNVTIEAGLLVAPHGTEASTPVIFLVNRQDTGTAFRSGVDTTGYNAGHYYRPYGSANVDPSRVSYGDSSMTDIRSTSSLVNRDLLRQPGLVIAEGFVRRAGGAARAPVLLFNNTDAPACGVRLRAGDFSYDVPGSLPPQSLFHVTVDAPAATPLEDILVVYAPGDCREPAAPGFLPSFPRAVLGNAGGTPRIELAELTWGEAPRPVMTPTPRAISSLGGDYAVAPGSRVESPDAFFPVKIEPEVDRVIRGVLDIDWVRVKRGSGVWSILYSGSSATPDQLGVAQFVFAVTPWGGGPEYQEEADVHLGALRGGREQTVTFRPRRGGELEKVRLVGMRLPWTYTPTPTPVIPGALLAPPVNNKLPPR